MLEGAEENPRISGAAGEAGATYASDVPSPPSYQEEAPPPYRAAPAGVANSILCKVCRAEIPMKEEFLRRYVVKCEQCQELTPIHRPPPGKRFLRCACRNLLCFSNTAHNVACSRDQCNRVIKVPVIPTPVVLYQGVRVSCVHCSQTFMGPAADKSSFAQCCHCQKVSFVGQLYARKRIVFFAVMTILSLIVTGVVIGLSVEFDLGKWIYVSWTFLLLWSLGYAYKMVFWLCVKISTPVQNSPEQNTNVQSSVSVC